MRVLQLIDSLEAGGAERMAVNLANSLSEIIEQSFLCSTRSQGVLKPSLSTKVTYLFLAKKQTIDFKAIFKLNRFIKQHNIQVIHAHSTSYFLATLIKLLHPKLVLVWHDHYGQSEFLDKRPKWVLKCCSVLFDHILCVNSKLETWDKQELHASAVTYLPNFAVATPIKPITILKGLEGKRIVCLANLRPQKDHLNLLKAFKLMQKEYPDWTLHLVGKDFNDDYSSTIKAFISQNKLKDAVFSYGSCSDVSHILSQSTIGVLSSKSEGLPIALLEYGLAILPVVATQVGDCYEVISNEAEGVLVSPEREKDLADAMLRLVKDEEFRQRLGQQLQVKVLSSFSESSIMDTLINIYKSYLK